MPNTNKQKILPEIEGTFLRRTFNFKREDVDEKSRTITLSFSSEMPVEKSFGLEVLDHNRSSVRLKRLNTRAPLLLNHDPNKHIGVVEFAEIGADRKGRAVVRFGKGELADEIFQDVIDDIRSLVSFSYRVFQYVLEDPGAEPPIYRGIDWEPFEISIESLAADISVGVGRSQPMESDPKPQKEKRAMPDTTPTTTTPSAPPPQMDERAIQAAAQSMADARVEARLREINEINEIGEAHGCRELAQKAIKENTSLDDFRALVLTQVYKAKPVETGESRALGMSEGESRSYSLIRAIEAARSQDWTKAGLELEASRAVEQKLNRPPNSFFIPDDVLSRADFLNVGTASEGGALVKTDLLTGSFIDVLRNKMLVSIMGARSLFGLVGDVEIPKQTGGATAYYLGEDEETTVSKMSFSQLGLTPHTLGGMTEMTRKMLMQSSMDIENMARLDLVLALAAAIDKGAIHGSGTSGQPTGIVATTGVGAVVGGTDGAAPTDGDIIDLETAVAIANADIGALGYLTNAKVRGKLKKTFVNDTYGETKVWTKGDKQGFGELNGYNAGVTNQVSSTLTKGSSTGVCSAIIFGNWADLILAFWGGLDVLVDPYSNSKRGRVRVTAFQDYDAGLRHEESFAVMLDALTD